LGVEGQGRPRTTTNDLVGGHGSWRDVGRVENDHHRVVVTHWWSLWLTRCGQSRDRPLTSHDDSLVVVVVVVRCHRAGDVAPCPLVTGVIVGGGHKAKIRTLKKC